MSFGKASFLLATVIPVEARGCLHRILRVKDADSGAWKGLRYALSRIAIDEGDAVVGGIVRPALHLVFARELRVWAVEVGCDMSASCSQWRIPR